MNYDFSQKRHWRRSLWNCIADRVQTKPRDALVLYLAGEKDEDRPVALAKGFRDSNLIAIEADHGVAQGLRQRGTLTLEGDAFEHAMAWNPTRHVDALILDLCGGLTAGAVSGLGAALDRPQFDGAVVAINMLRGRDAASNTMRALHNLHWQEISNRCNGSAHAPTKSRAMHLQFLVERVWTDAVLYANGAKDAAGCITERAVVMRSTIVMQLGSLFKDAAFKTLTYRSTANQTFDTLLFRNVLSRHAALNLQPMTPDACASRLRKLSLQQAAILAHRTRRIEARRT